MKRRVFHEKLAQISAASGMLELAQFDFSQEVNWQKIKSEFGVSHQNPKLINLNSGSAGVMPTKMINALHELYHFMNSIPPYQVLNHWAEEKKITKVRLARFLGCQTDEIAVQRNATEALNNIILGHHYEAGDEVITSVQDYPSVINALNDITMKQGTVVKTIDTKLPNNDESIVKAYEKAITDKTVMIVICHVTYRDGQILPIKAISNLAAKRNISLVLDAAHSVGHFEFKLNEFAPMYMGTSLHKWLMAPLGTGLLRIPVDRIKNIKPLYSAGSTDPNSIAKFSHIGTHDFSKEYGIKFALDFLDAIGIDNKENRLKYLTNYWIDQLNGIPGFRTLGDISSGNYCGIIGFKIEGVNMGKLTKYLKDEHNIYIKYIMGNGGHIRVSVNIFNDEKDLDQFTSAVKSFIK